MSKYALAFLSIFSDMSALEKKINLIQTSNEYMGENLPIYFHDFCIEFTENKIIVQKVFFYKSQILPLL